MVGVRYLLETGDANSRLVFLLHGISVTLSMLILSVAFMFAHNRDGYTEMVLALGGSGGMAAVGRMLTKKDGSDGPLPKPPVS
jgi:hypothetical protein